VTAVFARRRRIVLENQGLLGIAFFEASAFVILLVLFSLFRRDHHAGYLRFWLAGWCCLTFSAGCEVALLVRPSGALGLAYLISQVGGILLLVLSVINCAAGSDRKVHSAIPLISLILVAVYYVERSGTPQVGLVH